MVKIEDDIANPLTAEPVEHALDERGAAEGHGGLGDEAGEGIKPGPETGCEYERGQHGADCRAGV